MVEKYSDLQCPCGSGIDICYIILQYHCQFGTAPAMPETPQDVITSSLATNGIWDFETKRGPGIG